MLSPTPRLREFENEYQRATYRSLTFPEALEHYRAMLHLARLVRPDLGVDWREDLGSDLAIARALNGLSPT